MGKDKYRRFQENLTFRNMIQPEFVDIFGKDHPLKGRWHADVFGNSNPIVLELGCGRGEYTVSLARKHADKNYIGVDIKGARMWRGAKTATEEGIGNAAFLRTRIEFINSFFSEGEVAEIWITFPDPQLKKQRVSKRLTSPGFLACYAKFLDSGGCINLKTDSRHLHEYTKAVVACNGLPIVSCTDDLYSSGAADDDLSIKTAYEQRFLQQGLPITYLRFALGGRKEFVAPDFDEENNLDEGRVPGGEG